MNMIQQIQNLAAENPAAAKRHAESLLSACEMLTGRRSAKRKARAPAGGCGKRKRVRPDEHWQLTAALAVADCAMALRLAEVDALL